MFASALDRAEVVGALLQHGADAALSSNVVDQTKVTAPEDKLQEEIREPRMPNQAQPRPRPTLGPRPRHRAGAGVPAPTRSRRLETVHLHELIRQQGGLTPLHFGAARARCVRFQTLVEMEPTSTR